MTGAVWGVVMAAIVSGAPARTPVLVELYSSEGCSSCPPADAFLRTLDQEQPIPGVVVIALELHVDYWNRLGWTDPFSSHDFSVRQSQYAAAFRQDGVYTPQLVVDGSREMVGSREGSVRGAIAKSAQLRKATVRIEPTKDGLSIRVPPSTAVTGSEVWLAITERGLATDVKSGENAGEHLAHGPVVRRLVKLGTCDGNGFAQEGVVRLPPGVVRENARVVVFVQDPASRRILGVAAVTLA